MKRIIKLTESDLRRIIKRVINEQGGNSGSTTNYDPSILNSILGQKMNFYYNENEDGKHANLTLTSDANGITQKWETNIIPLTAGGYKSIYFNCNTQNLYPGRMEAVGKDGRSDRVHNKTVAEKYFIPLFCTTKQNGQIVQKVDNPDFANLGSQDSTVSESIYSKNRRRYYR